MQTGPKNSAPVPLELGRCISAIVTSLNNKLSSGASQEYRRSFDLGVIEWRIIFQLASERWSTGAQLSQAIGLDKAAVSRSLAQLKARQLVRFRPASGRRIEVALTQKGWATYNNVLPVALQRETRLLTGFTAAEVDQLVACCIAWSPTCRWSRRTLKRGARPPRPVRRGGGLRPRPPQPRADARSRRRPRRHVPAIHVSAAGLNSSPCA